MKAISRTLAALLLLSSLFIVGCDDDKDPKKQQSNIVGTWKVRALGLGNIVINGVPVPDINIDFDNPSAISELPIPHDLDFNDVNKVSWIFTSDNKLYVKHDNSSDIDQGSYRIEGGKITMVHNEGITYKQTMTLEIEKIDKKEMILKGNFLQVMGEIDDKDDQVLKDATIRITYKKISDKTSF